MAFLFRLEYLESILNFLGVDLVKSMKVQTLPGDFKAVEAELATLTELSRDACLTKSRPCCQSCTLVCGKL